MNKKRWGSALLAALMALLVSFFLSTSAAVVPWTDLGTRRPSETLLRDPLTQNSFGVRFTDNPKRSIFISNSDAWFERSASAFLLSDSQLAFARASATLAAAAYSLDCVREALMEFQGISFRDEAGV